MFTGVKNKTVDFFRYVFNYPKRLGEIYGILIAIGLILFFFLMWLIGALHVIELRFLNLFIMAGGIYAAIDQYKRTHHHEINYFRALAIGVGASFIGASTFVLILFVYLLIDKEFMAMLQQTEPFGEYLNPFMVTYAVWIEGTFSGITATYILCNSVKTKPATKL